jgi:hypothetical protein
MIATGFIDPNLSLSQKLAHSSPEQLNESVVCHSGMQSWLLPLGYQIKKDKSDNNIEELNIRMPFSSPFSLVFQFGQNTKPIPQASTQYTLHGASRCSW